LIGKFVISLLAGGSPDDYTLIKSPRSNDLSAICASTRSIRVADDPAIFARVLARDISGNCTGDDTRERSVDRSATTFMIIRGPVWQARE
jgi:hypothetical protein